MTSGTSTRKAHERQQILASAQAQQAQTDTRRRVIKIAVSLLALLAVVAAVTAALLSARPEQSDATRLAPDFTLPSTDGSNVTLSDLQGAPVLLYFSEGAGCDACIVQMSKIEADPGFTQAGITVLPIVMNTAEQINADRTRLGVKTPFLLDDGTVSKQYDTLGTGMHAGLPGHGFVLVDAQGNQVWSGDYPSMWIEPSELLAIAEDKLT